MTPPEEQSQAAGHRASTASGRVLDAAVGGLGIVAAIMLCILATLICADVAIRYMRLGSLPWVFDLTEYFLYASTFAAAPWVLRTNGHISIDILVERLDPARRARLQAFGECVSFAICAVLSFVFAQAGWMSFSSGTAVRESFVFPEWFLFVVAPVVFVLMALIFLHSAAARLAGRFNRRQD